MNSEIFSYYYTLWASRKNAASDRFSVSQSVLGVDSGVGDDDTAVLAIGELRVALQDIGSHTAADVKDKEYSFSECARRNRREYATAVAEHTLMAQRLNDEPSSKQIQTRHNLLVGVVARYRDWFKKNGLPVPKVRGVTAIGRVELPKPIRDQKQLTQVYIAAVDHHRVPMPTLAQLSAMGGHSKPWWSRKLKDAGFLLSLKDELAKKHNQAKTDPKRNFWAQALLGVEDRLHHLSTKIQRSRERTYGKEIEDLAGDVR